MRKGEGREQGGNNGESDKKEEERWREARERTWKRGKVKVQECRSGWR